jgi:arsenate reductase
MKLKLYTYPTCITSKKARTWLEEKGVDFQEVDMKGGLTESQLDKLIGKLDTVQFFNPRNPICRERKIKANPPARTECIQILAGEPKAIRRPMLQKGRKIAFGFKPEEYEELI